MPASPRIQFPCRPMPPRRRRRRRLSKRKSLRSRAVLGRQRRRPARPNLAEELQRGNQLLSSNGAEAQKTFNALVQRTDLPPQERRQALLGLARADARLNQWNEAANALKQVQGKEFEALPPLRDA